jgi:hypothetical protein
MIPMTIKVLNEKKIDPIIKVKRNSVILSRNNKIRNKEVKQQQTKDFLKWKTKKRYGHRWMAKETAFSAIKRMFIGEHIMATNFQNMVKEMMLKVSLYNIFRRTV